ncbi:hypothetical protein NC652_034663 [Populus alba x Populus x berolinensis]|nr:hypothetical protein NC652_034663 [Populus alba x Populus x berolinensis]
MRSKKIEREWLSVKESEIWDLPNEGSQILLALSLSYMNLKPAVMQTQHLGMRFFFFFVLG